MNKKSRWILIIGAAFIAAPIIYVFCPKNYFAVIKFTSSGCFHYEQSTLYFFENDNNKMIRLETKGKAVQEKVINAAQLDSFKSFVKELDALVERHGCTTEETYFVKYGNEIIKKTNGNCSWSGFSKLKMSLFL